jgi:H+/gluconate symporter-like permease
MFTLAWAPDIPGSYTVIASFAGSKSYYGSYAETSFVATSPPTSAPTAVVQTVSSDTTQMYVIGIGVAIIIAIAIVGAIIMMTLRKRP